MNLKEIGILILDDKPENSDLLNDLLGIKGYTNVLTLNDSTKALETIRHFQPGLLLLDLNMPEVNGFDILNELKLGKSEDEFMRVLVITADATRESKKKALNSGAHDFVTKPFDLTEVELRIRNLLLTHALMQEQKQSNQELEIKVKKRTAEIEEMNERLLSTNKALQEIAWEQNHLVRAPLARMMGLINILELEHEEGDPSPEELLKQIVYSANELDDIIRKITLKTYVVKLNEPIV